MKSISILLIGILSCFLTQESSSAWGALQESEHNEDASHPFNSLWWQAAIGKPMVATDDSFTSVSLDDLVITALARSQKIKIARLGGFIEQEKVNQRDAQFDWELFTESLFKDTNRKTGSALDAGNGIAQLEQQELNNEIGIRRTNARGGRFEATQNLNLFDSNSLFLNQGDQGLTQLTMRYTQPLLQEGGLLVNYGQVIIAKLNADAAVSDSESEIAKIIVDVVEAYWEIYRLRSRYVIQKDLVGLLNELHVNISQRSKIDARQSLIGQVEFELANQIATLGTTRTQLIQAQYRLIRVVGDRQLGQFKELIPQSHAPFPSVLPDRQATISLAIKMRPEVRAATQRIKGSSLFQSISQRQLLPKLALVMESSVNGVNGNFDLGRSLGDQFSAGAPTYSVGLNYQIPIGNRSAKSRLRESEYLLAREVAQLEDAIDQIAFDVNSAMTGLDGFHQQLDVRVDSIQKADLVVKSLLKRRELLPDEFDQISQLYVREILDAQQRKATAENQLVDLLFDYSKAVIQLRQATGALISQYGEATPEFCLPTRKIRPPHNSHFAEPEQLHTQVNAGGTWLEQPMDVPQAAMVENSVDAPIEAWTPPRYPLSEQRGHVATTPGSQTNWENTEAVYPQSRPRVTAYPLNDASGN